MVNSSIGCQKCVLYGELQETVFMHQPMGFHNQHHPDYVCLLKKSLYGLKQALRAWYKRFADFIFTMGFHHSRSDHSLFVYHHGQDTAYLLLYVDDIILVTSSISLQKHIISILASEFAMKDLGRLNYFLGIAVIHYEGGLFLYQRKYAEEILDRAGMSTCKPCHTPVDTKSKFGSSRAAYDNPTYYRSLAGGTTIFNLYPVGYKLCRPTNLFSHAFSESRPYGSPQVNSVLSSRCD